jgi:hypothetical protein
LLSGLSVIVSAQDLIKAGTVPAVLLLFADFLRESEAGLLFVADKNGNPTEVPPGNKKCQNDLSQS